MAEDSDLIILDGCTFFYSTENGDVDAEDAEGFFYQDVRHLSRWQVRVDDNGLDPLTSRRVDYYSARIVCKTNGSHDDAPAVSIRRDRFVTEGAHEDIVLENLRGTPHRLTLELEYASDFADVMEAQDGGNREGRSWQDVRSRSVTLWNDREGYRPWDRAHVQPLRPGGAGSIELPGRPRATRDMETLRRHHTRGRRRPQTADVAL